MNFGGIPEQPSQGAGVGALRPLDTAARECPAGGTLPTMSNEENKDMSTKVEMQAQIEALEAENADLIADNEQLEDMVRNPGLSHAFDIIAHHFTYEDIVWDRDLQKEAKGNKIAFVQKLMLDALCYGANHKLENFFPNQRAKIVKKIRDLQRTNRHDEITLNAIAQQADYLENAGFQEAFVTDFYREAQSAYTRHTGEVWKPYDPKAQPKGRTSDAAAVQAKLAAMGLDIDLTPSNTNGVETDEADVA